MEWYLKVLRNYAGFYGRARRKEFWMFMVWNTVIALAVILIDLNIGTFNYEIGLGLLNGIYNLAVLIPGIAVSIRRLHDIGRSGWWFLFTLVPFIGVIVLIVFYALDSEPGPNEYGDNPKAEPI